MGTLALSSFVLPSCNLLAIENGKAKQETMTLAYMLNILLSVIYRQILLAKAMKHDFYNISLEHCTVSIGSPRSGFILVIFNKMPLVIFNKNPGFKNGCHIFYRFHQITCRISLQFQEKAEETDNEKQKTV